MKKSNIFVGNKPLTAAKELWQAALEDIEFGSRLLTIHFFPVDEALGCRLADPVFANQSSPSYNAAAMDGIAVHFADLAQATEALPVHLTQERFMPVNTGNVIPAGFDAVVMSEDVHYVSDEEVELAKPAIPWQHVRTIGEDIVATELILPEGHKVRPIDQAALLAAGVTKINIRRPPKVLVIPTGNELIQPGQGVKPGQVLECNSRILAGYLNDWGAEAKGSLPVIDDPQHLRKAIDRAVLENDIVVINAGASAGTRDYTSDVLAEIGEIIVHGVAIKPGKPVVLAIVDDTPVIGLPGYPVSAILTMRLFVREMIYTFMNLETPKEDMIEAVMSRPWHSSKVVDEYVRVTLGQVDNSFIATPIGKGAGSVMSLVRADGLLTLPAGCDCMGAGDHVQIELLRPRQELESTLVFIGSHDNILDVIANQLHNQRPSIRISSSHVGSMGGIMAIRRGEAHLAGTHLLDDVSGEYNISYIKRFLGGIPLQLINLCYREQGLLVEKGNPLAIEGFSDIARRKLSFINRQNGAGTRVLTDKILRDLSVDPRAIQGYNHEEYTHMGLAAAIAGGSVDTGMGIRAAAVAHDLDFVSVTEERYDLILPLQFREDEKVDTVLEIMKNDMHFHKKVLTLGGYDLRDCGKVMYEQK
ncbi:MAG: molybdopterin biosynthesis protein [Proteobacteria bacterium]|nr:molybdopterin biosynthesis protein [Pseudomonadota bacterium]MBU1060389.1 molybdopterin biosynthesis protein [Pseudomonadota bacterium]